MTHEKALNRVKGYLTDIIPSEDYSEVEEIIEALELQLCDDCISRENTLKAMIKQLGIKNEDYLIPAEATLYKVVQNMPPVTPKTKTGHWIKMPLIETGQAYSHECSLCGRKILATNANLSEFPYCHCGATMVEPQEVKKI